MRIHTDFQFPLLKSIQFCYTKYLNKRIFENSWGFVLDDYGYFIGFGIDGFDVNILCIFSISLFPLGIFLIGWFTFYVF